MCYANTLKDLFFFSCILTSGVKESGRKAAANNKGFLSVRYGRISRSCQRHRFKIDERQTECRTIIINPTIHFTKSI